MYETTTQKKLKLTKGRSAVNTDNSFGCNEVRQELQTVKHGRLPDKANAYQAV